MTTAAARVLVGGVGYRWQRDGSFGLAVSDALAREQLPDVEVRDLGFGALYVALDLADARPPFERIILVAGVARGREPGCLSCRRWIPRALEAAAVQACIQEAGAGVIDLDLLLVIGQYFGAFTGEVLVVELEPLEQGGGEALSEGAAARLPEALALVRRWTRGEEPLPRSRDAAGHADMLLGSGAFTF